MPNKIKTVVTLSGGMDSTVCATLAVREHGAEHVAALHVSYGQRTEAREQRAFQEICDRLGITRRLVVRNQALSQIGGSALTDNSLAVPTAGPEIGRAPAAGSAALPVELPQRSRRPPIPAETLFWPLFKLPGLPCASPLLPWLRLRRDGWRRPIPLVK